MVILYTDLSLAQLKNHLTECIVPEHKRAQFSFLKDFSQSKVEVP